MSPGFIEVLSYFPQVLHWDLSALQFPGKSIFVQYADDLLLCSVTREAPIQESVYLLQQLAEKGLRVFKKKLQLSLDTIHYLGQDQSTEGIRLSPKELN